MTDTDAAPTPPSEEASKVSVPDSAEQVTTAEALHAAKLEIVKLLNQKRTEAGVEKLEFSSTVSASADKHCQEMVANGTLSH